MMRIFLPKISKVECLPLWVLQAQFMPLIFECLLESHPVHAWTGTSGISRASTYLLYSGLFQIGTGTAYLLVIEVHSPYLSTETALQSLPSTTDVMSSSSTQVGEVCEDGVDVTDENLMVADIPHRMICIFDLHNYSKMYYSLLMYIATTSCLIKELSAESQNNSKRK